MGTTANYGLRYPDATDAPEVWVDMEELADDVDAALATVGEKPILRLVQQTGQALADGAVVALQFGTGATEIDSHGFHSETVNNTRATPTVPGWYRVTASVGLPGAVYSRYSIQIHKNGTAVSPYSRVGGNSTAQGVGTQTSLLVQMNGSTDYVEAYAAQSSTASRNTATGVPFQSVLEVEWVRSL